MERLKPLHISKILGVRSFVITKFLKIVTTEKLYFKYLQKKDNYLVDQIRLLNLMKVNLENANTKDDM